MESEVLHPEPMGIDLEQVRRELSSAVISDVLDLFELPNRCLATGLAPLDPDQVLVGHAFPAVVARVYDRPADPFRGLVTALGAIEADEVFVTATHRAVDIAVWGELLSAACQHRGAAGALTDGLIRDTRQIRAMGFPVVSAGTIPYDSLGRNEIAGHRVPVVIDGVRIEPGDLVVADADGVVVVPSAHAEDVVGAATRKRRAEQEFRQAVLTGTPASEAFTRFGVL